MSEFAQSKRWVCLLLVLLVGLSRSNAAERHPPGREVFRQHCVKCHGRSGEGVKGKFDGPLQGERSLEKLTRYIERNMPDDAPGTCVGADASAVARYIYDAFYSREAQLRNHPARVELVRLTNLQFLNSVADLLKEFTGRDGALKQEHGLQAAYCNTKDFNGDKKAIERIDRQVDYEFGTSSPDEKLNGTNGFSIQWHGSLKTDESGDYEFILKTPNGARLWVNDNTEPLIDAWVASGELSEHKATLRLLGGRAYPLRLHFFKAKEKTAGISLQWKPPRGAQEPIPPRNLSPGSTSPTFVITTPFPPDDSSLGYERGMSVSKAWDEATTQAGIELANYVANNLDRLSKRKPADTNRMAKLETFCHQFAATAFRRAPQQKSDFVSAQFKKLTAKTPGSKTRDQKPFTEEDAVKRSVLWTLKSPRFLYLGLDDARPDDFEVATRLAYGLWDSLPDLELRNLAAQGALHTREQVGRQAQRMLKDLRAHAKMERFFHHWLQMDRTENLSKDEKVFPDFTPAMIGDLRTSLDLFLEDSMWSEASDYRTLLLADYLFVNNRLAEFYGLSTNANEEFFKATPEPNQRSGVLTHPYLLAAFSYQKLTSPIHRGVFLTRNIVGRALKPPPMAMTFKDADFAPNLTMREKVTELTRSQTCQTCHSVINPLGFSLEQYDAVGRFRTSEHEKPINPVSDYLTDDGQTIHLTGARDIAAFAIANEQAQNIFIEQLFHHLVKQPALAFGANTLDQLRLSFVASDFNMQKLALNITTLSVLHGVDKSPETTDRSAR